MTQGKPRVLIADDDSMFRQILKVVASAAGWEVVGEAEDGPQAVEMVNDLAPDMLWLDVNMPTMNGGEALRQIRSQGFTHPVIMLTGDDTAELLEDCMAAGANACVAKSNPAQMGGELQQLWHELHATG